MKVLTVVGARPQFVKAAMVTRALTSIGGIDEVIVHTGQHFDANMSDVFFEEMQIPAPNHRLEINSLSHGAMTGRMIEAIERILLAEQPTCLLVYGDTNSTLAGTLAAVKLQVPVAHIEAGLRSFDMGMPEEVNRILTDRASGVLYCPTQNAVDNLMREGFARFDCRVVLCGDVMEDAALFYSGLAQDRSTIIADLGLAGLPFLLCTLHRAENTDDSERLAELAGALEDLSRRHTVVLPLHPRTRAALRRDGIELGIRVIDPVGYLDMIALLSSSSLVITDSGGLQKEAYFFNRFCVTMRDQTEWVELVENGFNVVAGAERGRIVDEAERMLSREFRRTVDLYGGGSAATRIARDLAGAF